jgi:hypothetical protein
MTLGLDIDRMPLISQTAPNIHGHSLKFALIRDPVPLPKLPHGKETQLHTIILANPLPGGSTPEIQALTQLDDRHRTYQEHFGQVT